MKKRSVFWDNYKGILIFLVVFGHYIYSYANRVDGSLAQELYRFIYTFHMPAFIFCSGYFSKSEHSRSREPQTRLFLYYVVFNTLMLVFAYFYLGSEIKLLTPYYSFWYILSLILWRAMIGVTGKVKGIFWISLIVTLALGYWSEFTNVLALRRTVAFFVFFVAGYRLDREKVDAFLARRKPVQMVLSAVAVLGVALAAFWAVQHFGITDNMCMMVGYKDASDILIRLLILVIAAAAIVGMMLVVPNCKIPFLSQIGRNSLLIYLAHRFFTIIFYKEFFPYADYTGKYLVYAFLATVLTCLILGNEKLNSAVAGMFDKAAAAVLNRDSKPGIVLKAVIVLVFALLLCVKAVPMLADDVVQMKEDFAVEETVLATEPSAEPPAESAADTEPTESVYEVSIEQEAAIDNAVKLAYVGDLILLKDQVTSAYDEDTGTYDFSAMFEYAAPYLTEADLAIGIFEGPAAGGEKGYSTSNYGDGLSLYLNYPDEFAQAAKDAGIDLVSLANNHLMDMGLDGALRTIDVMDQVGLLHTGAYRNQEEKDELLIVEVDGIKIAVLSYIKSMNFYKAVEMVEDYSYLTSLMPYVSNPYYDQLIAEIQADFEQANQSGADLIMVMAHMGTQFEHSTDAFQRKFNAMFAELGADIILGDHAHAVQPIEYIGDTVVVNCPGNFANSYVAYNGDATAIVEIYIDRDSKKVIASSVIPMYTQEMEQGYFRALPIYSIMEDEDLRSQLWSRDMARIQEVHKLITEVMVGEAISLNDIQERYYFIDNEYHETRRTLLKSSADYADSELYQLIQEASSVTFIGDSITAGTKNDWHPWYEPLMEDCSDTLVTNISEGGYTTKRIMSKYGEDILASQTDLYVIALGTNDIRYRKESTCAMTPEEYVEVLDSMVELIRQSNPEAKVVFIAPWMTLENDTVSRLSHEEKNIMTDAYSEALSQYAHSNGHSFINANPYLREFFADTTSRLYTKDGIHPNATVGVELYSLAVLESSR